MSRRGTGDLLEAGDDTGLHVTSRDERRVTSSDSSTLSHLMMMLKGSADASVIRSSLCLVEDEDRLSTASCPGHQSFLSPCVSRALKCPHASSLSLRTTTTREEKRSRDNGRQTECGPEILIKGANLSLSSGKEMHPTLASESGNREEGVMRGSENEDESIC